MAIDILLTMILSWLLLWVEHWFPWRLMFRKELPRLLAYIMGVLALHAPTTVLFIFWARSAVDVSHYGHVIALWSVTIAGGLAVLSAYGIDWLLDRLARSTELRELLKHWRDTDAARPLDE